jgi:membrane protease YdiL (CAAX protease family)
MTQAPSVRARARASSWLLFAFLAIVSIAAVNGVGSVFTGDRIGATLGRAAGYLAVAALLVAGSIRLLKRDNLPADRLGLAPTGGHARAFLLGCVGACLLMAVLIAALAVASPFDWQPGSRSVRDVGLAGLSYLCGNLVEELLFRGYALIALARIVGTTRALWILALPFGLFHAPGLDPMALAKMILTTGAMHFVFAYAYLGTRSLWAATSLHALANVLLHAVSGLGQSTSAFDVILHRPLPTSFDLPFVVYLFSAAGIALLMSRLPAVRRGAVWLEDGNLPDSGRA